MPSEDSSDTDRAEEASNAVIHNLQDRKGFDGWWLGIDSDIQDEIQQSLADEIRTVYSESDPGE